MKPSALQAVLRRTPAWLVAAVVIFAFCWLPLPPWLGLALLLTTAFWLGPILIYATQTRPTCPPVERMAPEQLATLPTSHQRRFAQLQQELQELGFRPVGWTTLVQPQPPLRGTRLLLQHPGGSDLAHVILSGPPAATADIAAASVGFRRRRTNGGWLSTGSSTLPPLRRPRAVDDGLSLLGNHPVAMLWDLHQVRVAADALAATNRRETDALADELGLNAEEIAHCIASGYWWEVPADRVLRPTARGALAMTLRLQPPWKQLAALRASWRGRQLRRRRPTAPA